MVSVGWCSALWWILVARFQYEGENCDVYIICITVRVQFMLHIPLNYSLKASVIVILQFSYRISSLKSNSLIIRAPSFSTKIIILSPLNNSNKFEHRRFGPGSGKVFVKNQVNDFYVFYLLFIITAFTGTFNHAWSLNTVHLTLNMTDDIVHEHAQANTAIPIRQCRATIISSRTVILCHLDRRPVGDSALLRRTTDVPPS